MKKSSFGEKAIQVATEFLGSAMTSQTQSVGLEFVRATRQRGGLLLVLAPSTGHGSPLSVTFSSSEREVNAARLEQAQRAASLGSRFPIPRFELR